MPAPDYAVETLEAWVLERGFEPLDASQALSALRENNIVARLSTRYGHLHVLKGSSYLDPNQKRVVLQQRLEYWWHYGSRKWRTRNTASTKHFEIDPYAQKGQKEHALYYLVPKTQMDGLAELVEELNNQLPK